MDYNRRGRTPEILHCPQQLHLINDSGGISKKGLTHEQNPLALICVPVVCLSFQPCTSSHLSSSPWVLSCSTLSQHTQFYPKSLLKHLMTPRLKAPQTSCCCLQTMTLREPRHSQPTIHHDWRMTPFFPYCRSVDKGQFYSFYFNIVTEVELLCTKPETTCVCSVQNRWREIERSKNRVAPLSSCQTSCLHQTIRIKVYILSTRNQTASRVLQLYCHIFINAVAFL